MTPHRVAPTDWRVYPGRAAAPSLCAAILVFFASAASADELPPPEGARRLDPTHAVWVDPVADRVLVDGVICRECAVLEFFACLSGTREHESIVAIDAPAFLIHTALLAAGAEPGRTVQYQPEYRAPEGERLEITVEWREGGETKSARIQEWVRHRSTAATMTEEFVFTGSGLSANPNTGEQQYWAETGEVICVANFTQAMIDVAAPSTKFGDPRSPLDDGLWYEPYAGRIPPAGTHVRIALKPTGERLSGATATVPKTTTSEFITLAKGLAAGAGSNESLRRARLAIPGWPVDSLLELLGGMDGATPTAENWLRLAIDTVAQSAEPGQTPIAELKAFLADTSHSPRARRTAWELIREAQPDTADGLLDGLLDDPSSELRYDAVAKLLDQAEATDASAREPLLRRALGFARSLDQMERIEKLLGEIDIEISLADELGLVREWLVAGPFDNRGGSGFPKSYPPEEDLSAAASFTGHNGAEPEGPFGWKPFKTDDRLGKVELNSAIGAHKEVAGYAWVTVVSDREQPIEVRHSSACATRVWIDGELVASDEIYHSGSPFDQRIAPAKLRAGENTLLVKICQNGQTQSWAATWPFTLRLTGPAGAPLRGVTTELPEAP